MYGVSRYRVLQHTPQPQVEGTTDMATADASVTSQVHPLFRWPAAAFRDLGTSEQNLWRAALLVTALIFGFEIIGWAEQRFVATPGGMEFVGNAAEASTRYFTIPHVIIGFLFMVTSARTRTMGKRLWSAGLLVAGSALCLVYGELFNTGGRLLGAAFLYSYFLVHELRDELNFYRMFDGSKRLADDPYFKRFGQEQIALLLMGVMIILWVSGTLRTPSILKFPSVSDAGTIGIAVMLFVALIATKVASYGRYAARRGISILQVVREHRQLIRLFATVFLLTIVGAIITDRLYPIILLHVSVWYVATCRTLKQRTPGPARGGTWSWMRGTLNGFRTLHIGLAVACMFIGAMAIYTTGPASNVWWLISPEAFPYWTIMHISVSFVPR